MATKDLFNFLVGQEQVYDIEVEGTHNFIANGILAHNTYISGNVGIGTTAPASGKLHVQGKCVTGDTLLPIVRMMDGGSWMMDKGGANGKSEFRRFESVSAGHKLCGYDLRNNKEISKRGAIWIDQPAQAGSYLSTSNILSQEICNKSDNAANSQRGIFSSTSDKQLDQLSQKIDFPLPIIHDPRSTIQFVPITDVHPGDYVLSLNEETQKIEPHRINGLLDMGVKPVFRLTTASGRTIRTTGNHPYLVRIVDNGSWIMDNKNPSSTIQYPVMLNGGRL